MTTTTQLRNWWGPACQARMDVSLLDAYWALDRVLARHVYRPEQYHTGAFNCRRITGGTGYSLHAFDPGERFSFWTGATVTTALAVDINWQRNPYGRTLVTDMQPAMIAEIKAIRTNNGRQVWRWGGDYSGNKDAMHFEITCSPADINTGINWNTVAGAQPEPEPTPVPSQSVSKEKHMAIEAHPTIPDRLDEVAIGEAVGPGRGGAVFHRTGSHWGDKDISKQGWVNIGGEAKSVDLAWVKLDPEGKRTMLVVTAQGMENSPWHNKVVHGEGGWQGWKKTPGRLLA